MAGAVLGDLTNVFVFADTAGALGNPTFATIYALCTPANELVVDAPQELAAAVGETSGTPAGRGEAITVPGSLVYSEITTLMWAAAKEGRKITAAQAANVAKMAALARLQEFNLSVLLQTPGATEAENITRVANALVMPAVADVDNISAFYSRNTKGFSPPMSTPAEGTFNKIPLVHRPLTVSPLLHKA